LPGIPDPYTGKFDNIGQFAAPSILDFGAQLQYDLSKKVTLVVNLANIVQTCFGGSKTGFTVKGACNYGIDVNGDYGDVGNAYNPGQLVQPVINSPYEPAFSGYPFNVYVSAKIKL